MTSSFSQHGEDLLMLAQFPEGFVGRVLEIGAWSPTTFSNSRLFIERGWEAVLVEPSPRALEKLVMEYGNNPRVKVIAGAVVPESKEGRNWLVEMRITEDAVSTSDEQVYETWKSIAGYYGTMWALAIQWIHLETLGQFDVLSIDAEGVSVGILADVLGMTKWHPVGSRKPPRVICVEFDGKPEVVRELAGANGYSVIMDSSANGTNMILSRRP
jgi:FkbM family methyltransferase